MLVEFIRRGISVYNNFIEENDSQRYWGGSFRFSANWEGEMKHLAEPKGAPRLAYLDNIRIFLTALVIVHHSSLAFGGGGSWEVMDPARDEITSIILTYFTAVNQTYFMSAFFLLAGYFTPRSLEKKGHRVISSLE